MGLLALWGGSLGRARQHVVLALERCSSQLLLLEGSLRLFRCKADVERALVCEQPSILEYIITPRDWLALSDAGRACVRPRLSCSHDTDLQYTRRTWMGKTQASYSLSLWCECHQPGGVVNTPPAVHSTRIGSMSLPSGSISAAYQCQGCFTQSATWPQCTTDGEHQGS